MTVGSTERYSETREALEQIQSFDASTLPRQGELGREVDFREALVPAQNLIDLFKRLSISALQDFPDQTLKAIADNANSCLKLFDQVLNFTVAQQSPIDQRNTIIANIKNMYQPTFLALHPFISYSLHRSADFQRLDSDARATLKSIEDKSEKVAVQLQEHEKAAKKVLDEIRKVAAEEGVLQQAVHFKSESDLHNAEADEWKKLTIKLAFGLGAFAVISLFIHKVPFLKPDSMYDAVQLSISKVLIFFVIAYMLFLSARNFLNHKHNAIVNKHRQNALLTHKALVEASGNSGVRDAVLVQAASCIFSPQSTGYTDSKSDGDIASQKSVIEILSKPVAQAVKEA